MTPYVYDFSLSSSVYLALFVSLFSFFFEVYGDHRDLHVLTHSFPTRRSSDLLAAPGIVAGVMITLIPALGAYLTPDLIGGTDSQMIANVIERQFKKANDWPFGAALSFLRSEEHTSELQSLMRISYAVFCLTKKNETK